MDDAADCQTEKAVDLTHPIGVAFGEVIVDRDDVDAFAGQSIQINGQRGDERFTFAGLHLGDVALMENHAADKLDVEVALAEGPLRGFANCRKRGNKQIVQRRAFLEPLAEQIGACPELLVRKVLNLAFECVDCRDARTKTLHSSLVGGAEDFRSETTERQHCLDPSYKIRLGRALARPAQS